MLDLKRLLHSKIGSYFISIILGLGLASLFRKSCNSKECYKFTGPKFSAVEKKVFKFDDSCYTFKPNAKTCSSHSKKVVQFA